MGKSCMACGATLSDTAKFCPVCGAAQSAQGITDGTPSSPPPISPAAVIFPDSARKWSWGAFWLGWIWGLFNRVWISLLSLIPLVNLVMMFVLGFKGREWAWKQGQWSSLEHFEQVQKRWDIAGWVVAGVAILMGLLLAAMDSGDIRLDEAEAEPTIVQAPQVEEKGIQSALTQGYMYSNGKLTPLPPETSAAPKQESLPYRPVTLPYSPQALKENISQYELPESWLQAIDWYLNDPKAFWKRCMTGRSMVLSRYAGVPEHEIHEQTVKDCQGLADSFGECLGRSTAEAATSCMILWISNFANDDCILEEPFC